MKLSFACALATTVSVVAFLAIFGLSAVIYDNMATSSGDSFAYDDGRYEVTEEASSCTQSVDTSRETNKPVVSDRPVDAGNGQVASNFGIPKFEKHTEPQKIVESNNKPAIPPFRESAATRETGSRQADELNNRFSERLNTFNASTTTDITNPLELDSNGTVEHYLHDPDTSQPADQSAPEFDAEEFGELVPPVVEESNSSNEYFDLAPLPSIRKPILSRRNDETSAEWLRSFSDESDSPETHDSKESSIADRGSKSGLDLQIFSEVFDSTSPATTDSLNDIVDTFPNEQNSLAGSTLDEALQPSIEALVQTGREIENNLDPAVETPTEPPTNIAIEEDSSVVEDDEIAPSVLPQQPFVGSSDQSLVLIEGSQPALPETQHDVSNITQPATQTVAQPATRTVTGFAAEKPEEVVAKPKAKTETITKNQGKTASAKRPLQKSASKKAKPEIIGWPLPESLQEDLQHLADFEVTREWSLATSKAFDQLNQMELSDPKSAEWLAHGVVLADQLAQYASQLSNTSPAVRESAIYMTQVSYRMKRRLKIWESTHRVAVRQIAEKPAYPGRIIAEQISSRTSQIQFDSLDAQWRDYLMLDQAQEVFANPNSSDLKYRVIAQKILARATSESLNQNQIGFAQNIIGNDLGEALRGVASGQVNLGQFLVDLEKHESKPTPGSKARLNNHFQNYYWSRDKNIQELSNRIDDLYRNANLRFEISDRLINLMIPNQDSSFNQPVSDRILGASVLGQSRITNRISVRLVPDPEHLNFRFHSDGRVLSRTRAHAKGFTFSNLGNGLVNASKQIAIGTDGIEAAPTNIRANSQTRLTNIQGQMDGVPVLGKIARRIAQQQQQAQGFQAKQIVEHKLSTEFRKRIDSEAQTKIEEAKNWFYQSVLNPLHSMELEPSVVQLQTTNNSAIVRCRLAALDQNAAGSPRPNSQPGSLASFQMHNSAINNIINRIHINGKSFSPQQFMDHLNVLLDRNDFSLPEGQQSDDVNFEFASSDAINLDFQEGMLEISLRIKKLQAGKRNRWKNLTVTARYAPTATGQRIDLKFDETFGLRISGYRLKLGDQIAVRTIFSTLFKPDFQFDMLPPELANHRAARNLAISQLVLFDGWLGVSFNEPQRSANMQYYSSPR